MPAQSASLQSGLKAFKQARYAEAIASLEMFCQVCSNPRSRDFMQAQMSLAKAYHYNGEPKKALALTRKLVRSDVPEVQAWARQVLQNLSPDRAPEQASNQATNPATVPAAATANQSPEAQSTIQIYSPEDDLSGEYLSGGEPPGENSLRADRPQVARSDDDTLNRVQANPTHDSEPAASLAATPAAVATLPPQQATALYQEARQALQEKRFPDAIATLETYCQGTDVNDQAHLQAKMWLVKAYQNDSQPDKAADLCRQLADSPHAKVQTWAQRSLPMLLAAVASTVQTPLNQIIAPAGGTAAAPKTPPQSEPGTSPKLRLRSMESLASFHRSVLGHDLVKFEQSRKKTLRSLAIASSCLFVLAILILSFAWKYPMLLLGTLVGGLIAWVFFYSWFTRSYGEGFKTRIVQRIIEFIDTDGVLSYAENININATITAFQLSGLFGKHYPDIFRQDDCVFGRSGETEFFFSEICAESESPDIVGIASGGLFWGLLRSARNRDSGAFGLTAYLMLILFRGVPYIVSRMARGRRLIFSDFFEDVVDNEVKRKTLFKGLFFRANFNKSFQGKTVVLPDVAERLFGGVGRMLQSWNTSKGELIQLEDPEFERFFAVYGDDQIEARYILSTNLMARLTDFRKRAGRDLYISFVGNTIHIAVKYEEDLFEPKLFYSMLKFAPIKEYYEIFRLMLDLVEELKLNRRIWKQS